MGEYRYKEMLHFTASLPIKTALDLNPCIYIISGMVTEAITVTKNWELVQPLKGYLISAYHLGLTFMSIVFYCSFCTVILLSHKFIGHLDL